MISPAWIPGPQFDGYGAPVVGGATVGDTVGGTSVVGGASVVGATVGVEGGSVSVAVGVGAGGAGQVRSEGATAIDRDLLRYTLFP